MFLFGPCFSIYNSKKTKQLLGFKKPRKKIRQNKKAWFSLKGLCIGWGRKQKTNENPGRNPRQQKTKCFGWISAPKKRTVHTPSGHVVKSQSGGYSFFILFRAFFYHQSFTPIGLQKTNAASGWLVRKISQLNPPLNIWPL